MLYDNTPCSLESWYLHRLNTEVPQILFTIGTTQMQSNLIVVINEMNKYIVSANCSNGMATPFLANTTIQAEGQARTTENIMTD